MSETCPNGLNWVCDGGNNNPGCNYDDGDCCIGSSNCQHCTGSECTCHVTGELHCAGEAFKMSCILIFA